MARNVGKYREFTDKLKAELGDLNWGQIGRMSKVYSQDFILFCSTQFTPNARSLSASAKTTYLAAICRKHATQKDYLQKNTLDMSGF